MTFLFKNKLITFFLLSLTALTTPVHRKIDHLKASEEYSEGIKLTWKVEATSEGESVEIQRALHNTSNYEAPKDKRPIFARDKAWIDKEESLKPIPTYYDYRIRIQGTNIWSNIAKGGVKATAMADTAAAPLLCKAVLSLNEVLEKQLGKYVINYAYNHDCGKEHLVKLFLSQNKNLEEQTDVTLRLVYRDSQQFKAIVYAAKDTIHGKYLVLKIGDKWDVKKITVQHP